MTPPVFRTCIAHDPVLALLGEDPTRLYSFGQAPQDASKPYAVWQVQAGAPENYLGQLPDVDQLTVQLTAYAQDAVAARAIAVVLRDAIEPVAHVVAWLGEIRDADTQLFAVAFLVDWFVHRSD